MRKEEIRRGLGKGEEGGDEKNQRKEDKLEREWVEES